jgi:IS30 family transposase
VTGAHRDQPRPRRRVVAELLGQRWSPEQISRQLRKRFPEEPAMWLSHESIYQAVYEPGSPFDGTYAAGAASTLTAADRP